MTADILNTQIGKKGKSKIYPKPVLPEMGKGIISLNWVESLQRSFFLSPAQGNGVV